MWWYGIIVGLYLVFYVDADRLRNNGIAGDLISSLSNPPPRNRELFNIHLMPTLSDTDTLEIYHLRSFPHHLVDISAGQFSLETSGLALRSSQTSALIILNYLPLNFSACFLPIIVSDEEEVRLYWDHSAAVFYHDHLDLKYWQQSTFLGTMNSVVYENFLLWVNDYSGAKKILTPYSICTSSEAISCYVQSFTWENFLSESLAALGRLGVRLSAIIPPRASSVEVIASTEPVAVVVTNSKGPTSKSSLFEDVTTQKESIEDNNSLVLSEENSSMTSFELSLFYFKVFACLEGYQYEDFFQSLKSCLPQSLAYVYLHKEGSVYHRVEPRHPFVVIRDYLQLLPAAAKFHRATPNIADRVIGIFLSCFALVGVILMLEKMKFLRCCSWNRSNNEPAAMSVSYSPMSRRLKNLQYRMNSYFYDDLEFEEELDENENDHENEESEEN